jgi:hypothetical protein
MLFDNLLCHPKPQPCTELALRGEEWFKYARQLGPGDPFAVIGNTDPDAPAPIRLRTISRAPQLDVAIRSKVVQTVREQVDEHPAQPFENAGDAGSRFAKTSSSLRDGIGPVYNLQRLTTGTRYGWLFQRKGKSPAGRTRHLPMHCAMAAWLRSPPKVNAATPLRTRRPLPPPRQLRSPRGRVGADRHGRIVRSV